jgi:hypothetical protein
MYIYCFLRVVTGLTEFQFKSPKSHVAICAAWSKKGAIKKFSKRFPDLRTGEVFRIRLFKGLKVKHLVSF